MAERETGNAGRARWLRAAVVVAIAGGAIGLIWLADGVGDAAVLLWGGVVFALVGVIR